MANNLYYSSLDSYTAILLTGEKAAEFLQGQLTCDIFAIAPFSAKLGAFCKANGRVIAVFWVLNVSVNNDKFILLAPEDIASDASTRLHKYALFSRVECKTIADKIYGFWGDGNSEYTALAKPAWHASFSHKYCQRHFIVSDDKIDFGIAKKMPVDNWAAANITDKIPMVYHSSTELFLPHFLELDKLDGISFTKGCYVGQEIVARMQYRGKVKKHLYRAALASEFSKPTPGTELYIPDNKNFVGWVVDSITDEQHELLLVLDDNAANTDYLFTTNDKNLRIKININ